MNSNDAVLLTNLDSYGSLVDYNLEYKQKPSIIHPMAEGVHLSAQVQHYSHANCLSISNLARLNIIECDKVFSGAEYLDYSIYENNSFYYSCQQEVLNNPELYSKLALKKYFFNMTAFGRTFKASCF